MQMRQSVLLCYLQILRWFLISHLYDLSGNMTSQTDAAGNTTTFL
jgi:hypothetical protein